MLKLIISSVLLNLILLFTVEINKVMKVYLFDCCFCTLYCSIDGGKFMIKSMF
ncbi:hypothetical protein psyc5s11_15610 [Clostridium gelidum]|uniref:Uncharacterized protein n=1 Tax=Clostridium gelidum TaxID=704125 RepID=A0ABM7T3L1_9CLOT|nr:hypothetical protein psyc5s11_15610 [Clostridium gelidum]